MRDWHKAETIGKYVVYDKFGNGEVKYIKDRELIIGYEPVRNESGKIVEIEFGVNDTVSRLAFITWIYYLIGDKDKSYDKAPYIDVDSEAVDWAYANGIINVFSDAELKPSKGITKRQLDTIFDKLNRYVQINHLNAKTYNNHQVCGTSGC